MRMIVSNSAEKSKYDDIHDLILTQNVRRKDSGEFSSSSFVQNVDNKGRDSKRDDKNSNKSRSKSKKKKARVSHILEDKLFVGIVRNVDTSKRIIELQRKK